MQMLVVFTGKTFGLQVVELSKPFIVRHIKVFLELCTLKNLAKSTANLSVSVVAAPIKLVSSTVHAAAGVLHPGEQEAGCVPCCASCKLLRELVCALCRVLTSELGCTVYCPSSAVTTHKMTRQMQWRQSARNIYNNDS